MLFSHQLIVHQLLSHLSHPTPSQLTASQALSLLSSTVSMTSSSATSLSSPLTLPSYWNLLTHCILSSLTLHNGPYANIEDFEQYFAVLIGLAYVSLVLGPALRVELKSPVQRTRKRPRTGLDLDWTYRTISPGSSTLANSTVLVCQGSFPSLSGHPHLCPAGPPTSSGPSGWTHQTLLASVLFSSWTLVCSHSITGCSPTRDLHPPSIYVSIPGPRS